MLGLGVVAWLLSRVGFGPAPIVLGVVLGPIAEQGFVQAWLIGGATGERFETFFMRPLAAAIIAAAALFLLYPLLSTRLTPTVTDSEANSKSEGGTLTTQHDHRHSPSCPPRPGSPVFSTQRRPGIPLPSHLHIPPSCSI